MTLPSTILSLYAKDHSESGWYQLATNIFDFSKDIYGDTIKIYWLDKIRDMVKFDGIESLLNQLKSDEVIARAWKA